MSFGHLLRSGDARLRLDLVRPPPARLEGGTLPPGRLAPGLAASAVANGVRLELARRQPESAGPWPAERAVTRLADLAPDMVVAAERALASVQGTSGRMEGVTPSLAAERALQLARLDAVVRAGYVDARIGGAEDPEDVAEVAAMLSRVPWDQLDGRAAAPPYFPRLGEAWPDAEPDLLVGGALLMVSASRAPRVDEEDLRGLVARLVGARAEWGADEAARRVRHVGVLLARHGLLWRVPAAPLVAHEAFPALEAWMGPRLEAAMRPPAAEGTEGPAKRRLPKWVKKRFAPRAPGTHPEGKAEKKKAPSGAPPKAKPKPPARPKAELREDMLREREREDGPARSSTPKPDWRRGSPWRRDRGL